ncbi:MAG: glycerate kinase type-2 family protein, partial [Candidatus Rokuibacteriota bacterium]
MSLRLAARAVFDAALEAADVRPLVHRALPEVRPPARGRVVVVGAGKASGAMAAAVEDTLGDHRIADGLVVVKDGYRAQTHRITLVEAGHPVPDARGEAAARRIRALAEAAGADDLLLVLVSGGGSALTPAPVPPITLEDKQAMTRLLLAAGANINQLNAVRKHCSLLKGGQLARAAAPARVHALLLSDVIGDPLDVIASGPTAPDASTFAEALTILERFDLRSRAPGSIVDRLERGRHGEILETPKRDDPVFRAVTNTVIGNNRLVVEAAAARALALGYTPHLLTRALEGEAREVAGTLVELARQIRDGRGPVTAPACVIAGGETTVTVRGR